MHGFHTVITICLIAFSPSALAQFGGGSFGGTTSSCSSLFRYNGAQYSRICGACMEGYYSSSPSSGSSACTACPAGFSSTRGSSTCTCTAANSSPQNGVCVCNSGAYSQGSGTSLKCTVCPTNQPAFNPASSTCYACPANSYFNTGTRTCVCNSGAYSQGSGTSLKCTVCPTNQPAFDSASSTCYACPANSYFNTATQACVCNDNANTQGSGKGLSCVVCPADSHFDTATNTCACNTNTESSGSGSTLSCKNCQAMQLAFDSTTQKCFSCPSVASPNGNTCTCPAQYDYYDSTKNACVKTMTAPSPDVYTYRKRNVRRHQKVNPLPGVELSAFSEKFRHKCLGSHQVPCSIGRKNSFECINVLTSLESCGGCSDSPTFKDCTTLEGASQVSCEQGRCIVSACDAGYPLRGNRCVRKA